MLTSFGLSISGIFESIDRFFTPDFGKYKNISGQFDENTVKWIVLGLYFGIVIASLVMYFNKYVLGAAPKAILKANAMTPENAMTVSELGIKRNIFVRLSLKYGYTLRSVIRCVGEENANRIARENAENATRMGGKRSKYPVFAKYVFDFGTDRFYIPEESRDKAAAKFRQKGNGIPEVILVAVVGLIVAILVIKFIPWILSLFAGSIGGLSQSADII